MRMAAVSVVAALLAGCGGSGSTSGGTGGVEMVRDATLGATYGVAGPRTCKNRSAPGDGPPSTEQAAALVTCSAESEFSGNLFVAARVEVSAVAAGRAYNPLEDINVPNIDTTKQVYAIRGSYDRYQCNPLTRPGGYDMGAGYRKGTNCTLRPQPAATGLCYADTFGDWTCSLVDARSSVAPTPMTTPPA